MTSLEISDRPTEAQTMEVIKTVVDASAVSLEGCMKTVRNEKFDEHRLLQNIVR